MTPERLAFTLREDDFLWVKLGRLKPKCEPLRYQAPRRGGTRRAAEIRRVVRTGFRRRDPAPGRTAIRVCPAAIKPDGAPPPPDPKAPTRLDPMRLVYSYLAVYGDPLVESRLDPYPDGFLQRLSAVGVNAVWLHAVLRELAPGGAAFPEFGAGHERRLTNLRALVERAKKYGIRVYLYMNEPRAMPNAFFKNRPEVAGVRDGARVNTRALCTSHPAVRQWMAMRWRSYSVRCLTWAVLRDNSVGKSDQLCFAWRLARLPALQVAHRYRDHR